MHGFEPLFHRQEEFIMKITFLGTAAATAMPLPFCGCDVCVQSRRLGGKNIRRRSSAVIDDVLLIDLGPDSAAAACENGIDISRIRYLLQTHAHSDHFDAGHLITRHPDYAGFCPEVLEIAATMGTLHAMNRMLQDEDGRADLFSFEFSTRSSLKIRPISAGQTFFLGEYKITALDSLHDPAQEAVVYYIEKNNRAILYGTDLAEADDRFFAFLAGRHLDVLILDHTYGFGVNSGGHLDGGMFTEILTKLRHMNVIDTKTQIYATHISHEGNGTHDRMIETAEGYGYKIAYDGLCVEIEE